MRSLLTTLLLFGATAHAVPAQFTHQGRLLDADGIPMEGEATITFRVITEETGGEVLWQEPITVDLSAGFYAAVLGTDEETNPLDTATLAQAPVWLELQLEGEGAMFPRSAINAVPYATMATVAEEVSGGPVDATEIAVDGTPVVNASGEWVGPAPTVNWADLEGIPEDFADGVDDDTDTDTDSFAALGTSCLDGDIPVWDSALVGWVCGIDAVLTADEVDTIVADNGYAMESEVFSSSFLDLIDVPDGLDDGDDNTQLTADEVDTIVADNGYAMATDVFSQMWSDLTGIPEDLADGDDNTQLTADEVDAIVADNGYAMAADSFSGSFDDLSGVPEALSEVPALEPLPASAADGVYSFRDWAHFHEFTPGVSGSYSTLQVRTGGFVDDASVITFALYNDDSGYPTARLTQTVWVADGDLTNQIISIPFSVTLDQNKTYHLMIINPGYTQIWADRGTGNSWVGRRSTAGWTTGPYDLSPYADGASYDQYQRIMWFKLI
jgi:hypothetical protein